MEKHLSEKSLLILFAYAPAGFGHLRVTDALYHGLPRGVTPPLLLGSQDKFITVLHRIMSTYPIIRSIVEWAERGIAEDITTFFYRLFLRSQTQLLYKQMITILDERLEPAKTVLIIATHFGLAHQLSAIKKRLEKEKKVRIVFVIQVTDDSPHHIWYVEGADITFVPSERTKEKLIAYGKKFHLKSVNFEVNAYPLSPLLSQEISSHEAEDRLRQMQEESDSLIHVSIPISGAAVGTSFFTNLIDELNRASSRFTFHVLSKEAPYTKKFIRDMRERQFVKLVTALKDQEIVLLYEELYKKEIVSLEITKPSEQAFKALLDYQKRGASILLFSEPVGRQEYDNLDFLRRHNLIPLRSEEKHLWKLADKNTSSESKEIKDVYRKARNWRGISLPKDPRQAGHFIRWCLRVGLFLEMTNSKTGIIKESSHSNELSENGVQEFWNKVEALLNY